MPEDKYKSLPAEIAEACRERDALRLEITQAEIHLAAMNSEFFQKCREIDAAWAKRREDAERRRVLRGRGGDEQ